MKSESISRVLWIKTLEEHDTKGEILPYFIRDSHVVQRRDAQAFDERAKALLQWLEKSRFRRLSQLPAIQRLFLNRPFTIGIALLFGAVLNLLGDQHRIQLLLNPFLFLWLWNFILFIALVSFFFSKDRNLDVKSGFLTHFLTRVAKWQWLPLRIQLQMKFLVAWGELCPNLLKQYMKQGFHLGALSVLFGAIAGLYIRGFLINYTFIWESTFLSGPHALQAFLDIFFAPASFLLNVSVPTLPAQGIDMRGDQWIHLFAITSLLYVGIPRTLLLLFGARHREANHDLPLLDPYFHQWVVDSPTWFLIYSMELESGEREQIQKLLGVKGSISISMVPWGESLAEALKSLNTEDANTENTPVIEENLRVYALFNGVQTPEAEIHGAALAGTQGFDLQVLLYDSPGVQKMSDERLELWKHLFTESGISRMSLISHDPEIHLVAVEL